LQNTLRGEIEKMNSGINLRYAETNYMVLSDTSYLGGAKYYNGNLNLNTEWTFLGIPVSFSFNNQYFSDVSNQVQNNFSFRFDKDGYLGQLKKRIADKSDPANIINDLTDPLADIKQQAEQLFHSDLSDIDSRYGGMLDKEINSILSGTSSVFLIDEKALRQKWMNVKFIRQVTHDEALLSSLLQKVNKGDKVNPDDISSLKNSVLRYKALQELLQKVEQHKAKWEKSGMLKKIKDFELLKKIRVEELVNDPSFIRKQAKQHLSLKGLQRFFLSMNKLNIGQDALSLSPMSFNHFLSNGFNTEFITGKGRTLMLMAGKQRDFNSILDYGFENSIFSDNGQMKALRIGMAKTKVSSSHVSVSSFAQSSGMNSTGFSFNPANMIRQVLVTTISNNLSLGKTGNISVDLSRSATAYQGDNRTSDTVLDTKNNFSRIFSAENFMANTAFSFNYSDENPENGLSYQVNFSKVANGYDNPGNSFLTNGSLEAGGRIRKQFLKNKLQASLRTNIREYKFNDELDRRWRSLFFVLDAKWKLKKGQFVSLRYQPNRMLRIEDGVKSKASSIDRVSVETNIYKKIARTDYRHLLSLTYFKNMYALTALENVSAVSLQVNSNQNILLGKNILSANCSYTYSDNQSQYVFFNSSFSSDISYSINLFRSISSSSGIVYSSVNNWYQQAGFRQSLNGEINKKFYISLFVDARKNLKLSQPLWADPIRVDLNVRYIIDNNRRQ
jgi:hypothetical protein